LRSKRLLPQDASAYARIDFVIMMFQQLGERVKHRYRAGKLRPQCCAT
jgi:hypothetical protein